MTKNNTPKFSKQAAQVHPALNAAFTHRRAKGNLTMTKSTRDIPKNEGQTVADRLKTARMNAGLTRKQLFEKTGIPASTIEKYERGELPPNTTRLMTICDHLCISANWALHGENIGESETKNSVNTSQVKVTSPSKSAETKATVDGQETSTVISTEALIKGHSNAENYTPSNENDPLEDIRLMLSDLGCGLNSTITEWQIYAPLLKSLS